MLLRGLVKLVALVVVAGGCGVAIGYALSKVSGEDDDRASAVGAGATDTPAPPSTTTPARTATTSRPPGAATTSEPEPSAATAPATTTTPAGALGEVQVRVLGAILRHAGTVDGRQRRRARLTMRVQAVNEGDETVTVERPVVAIGKVRVRTDTAADTADAQVGELAGGETKAATLRFELAGDATEKITIDRRARINIAGRSLPFRVRLGSPVTPAATTP